MDYTVSIVTALLNGADEAIKHNVSLDGLPCILIALLKDEQPAIYSYIVAESICLYVFVRLSTHKRCVFLTKTGSFLFC
jgi:hypothetical protein